MKSLAIFVQKYTINCLDVFQKYSGFQSQGKLLHKRRDWSAMKGLTSKGWSTGIQEVRFTAESWEAMV